MLQRQCNGWHGARLTLQDEPNKPVTYLDLLPDGQLFALRVGTKSLASAVLERWVEVAMESRNGQSRPYRTLMAANGKVWRVYAEDDEGQERFLGHVVREEDAFLVHSACVRIGETFTTSKEAALALYNRCVENGYLESGHPNYLRSEGENDLRPGSEGKKE